MSNSPKVIEARLRGRINSLREELASFTEENPKISGDFETRFERLGDSLEDAAMETEQYIDNLPVEHRLELRLREVEDALKRLEAGTYGKCEKCGKKIPEKRLEALPEARYCTTCESR